MSQPATVIPQHTLDDITEVTATGLTPVVFIPHAPPAQAPAPVLPVPVVAQAAAHFCARAPPLV